MLSPVLNGERVVQVNIAIILSFVRHGNWLLPMKTSSGGVVSPEAVDAARRLGANVVIAVDISGGVAGVIPETTLDTIFQSINVMYGKIAADQLSRADVVIQPKVGHIDSGDFTRRHEAILEGERAAPAALPKIQALLGEFVNK